MGEPKKSSWTARETRALLTVQITFVNLFMIMLHTYHLQGYSEGGFQGFQEKPLSG